MRIILNPLTDPAFNLAAEEYLLLQEDRDVFMLWQNDRAVIIGRNQNAWAEVNIPCAEAEHIAVIRRLSGGGAVYHDLGNVNFTFITAPRENVDFTPFIAPVIRALADLGVHAVQDGRNDITAENAKISGNAQCTFRRPDGTARLLHHGTLLLSSDLSRLAAVLRPRPEKLRAKGIASIRSRVTNLRDLVGFPEDMDAAAFMRHLADAAAPAGEKIPLSDRECAGIAALAREKYESWAWNFGASAAHETEHSVRFPFGSVTAAFSAKGGIITAIRLWGDYFGSAPVSALEDALRGTELRRDALRASLEKAAHPVSACIAGADAEDIVSLILGDVL